MSAEGFIGCHIQTDQLMTISHFARPSIAENCRCLTLLCEKPEFCCRLAGCLNMHLSANMYQNANRLKKGAQMGH
jgi:hypothetical protein